MKLRAAIIGLGKIGIDFDLKESRSQKDDVWTHYSAYKSLANQYELIAAVEVDENKIKDVIRFDKDLKIVRSIKELFSENVDVVSICTPESYHLQNIQDCLAFCRGIFVEKPLFSSETNFDLSLFQQHIHEKKIPVYVNYYKREEPAFIELLAYLNEETITSIICKYSGFLDAVGSHAIDLINCIKPIQEIRSVHHNDIGSSALFVCENHLPAYLNHTGEKNKLIFELEVVTKTHRFILEDNLAKLKVQKFKNSHRYKDYFELELEKEQQFLTNPNRLVGFLKKLHGDLLSKNCDFINFDQSVQSQYWLAKVKAFTPLK